MAHIQQRSTLSTASTVVNTNNFDHPNRESGQAATTRYPDKDKELEADQQTTPPGEHNGPNFSLPAYIPDAAPFTGKTLVLCFDGTGDQFDSDNSNIVQLVSMLKKDDKTKQMVYYQAGIGTYTTPEIATPFMSNISKILDEMLAWNLDAHVMGGYEFLMQNYIAGDRICIFGFSRGSYTARSLAGMVHKVGLLPADNRQQVPFAYKMYTRTDSVGWDQSNGFKKAFSVDVPIHFVGVWDTVDSVGVIPKRLPFTTSNTIIRTFRHAVSLDERRVRFKENLWNRPTEKEKNLGLDVSPSQPQDPQLRDEGAHLEQGSGTSVSKEGNHGNGGSSHHPKHFGNFLTIKNSGADETLDRFEVMYADPEKEETDVEEVWFAGCHCDIGGGSVENGTRYCLARIPLRWMVRECFKTNSGIIFRTDSLREIGIDPSTIYPSVLPRPPALFDRAKTQFVEQPPSTSLLSWIGSFLFRSSQATGNSVQADSQKISQQPFINEEDEELRDALSPKYDQLDISWIWWILEILPISIRHQKENNQWVSEVGFNLGQGRDIPRQRSRGVKVHRSVKLRMEAKFKRKEDKYEPQANLDVEPHWID
ncbi:hypothetical protein F5887DRAFT_878546 [Amanita rubescens]|nr:hypothetical protein F5887DRAFT_878546 [Amanita rubescens]